MTVTEHITTAGQLGQQGAYARALYHVTKARKRTRSTLKRDRLVAIERGLARRLGK